MKRREDDILEHLQIEDLSENLKFVAELKGIEFVRELIKECAGLQVYVPTIARMETLIRRYVETHQLVGKDLVLLARDLGITHRNLKKIIKPPIPRGAAVSRPGYPQHQLPV